MSELRRVLIGITGGIAAYKVGAVISDLAKAGNQVRGVLTTSAQSFITPLTVACLSRQRAHTDEDFWQASQGRPLHIELGEWAEVLLIAPLSAHSLAKLAHGLADNLLTNTVLASTCPVLLAPAMNTDMWQQAVVQRNWQILLEDPRYHSVGPGQGMLACDRRGTGRMAEPEDILPYLNSLLHTKGHRDLRGKMVLISGGGTQEYLDPVRFIGNPATGKMALALALAASHRGARVTLVHGPMDATLTDRLGEVQAVGVTSAAAMHQALVTHQPQADWIIMAAAVADVRPQVQFATKLAKPEIPSPLPLEPVVDIVADLAQRRSSQQIVIGFAAQTGEILKPALEKLHRKGLDAIVANPVDQPNRGFGSDRN
ncbi:MAG: bifunctional phosphopantothenoylcysteine decarboxylase/phosphopantothenate--cysteine ligase CoaBC, partial [Nodosilinea sp.]